MPKDSKDNPSTQDQLGNGIGNRRGTPGRSHTVEANPDGNREERRLAAKLERKKGK